MSVLFICTMKYFELLPKIVTYLIDNYSKGDNMLFKNKYGKKLIKGKDNVNKYTILLKDEKLFEKKNNELNQDNEINGNYSYIIQADLTTLKKLKYKCTLKAKKLNNESKIISMIPIVITIIMFFISTYISEYYNTINATNQQAIDIVDEVIIKNQYIKENLGLIAKTNRDYKYMKEEISSIIDKATINKPNLKNQIFLSTLKNYQKGIRITYIICVLLTIFVIIIFLIIIKSIGYKESKYEMLISMIEDRIKEIQKDK